MYKPPRQSFQEDVSPGRVWSEWSHELWGEARVTELPQPLRYNPLGEEHCPLAVVILTNYSEGWIFLPLEERLAENFPLKCPMEEMRT